MSTETPAVVAEPQSDADGDGRWMSLHERFVLEAKSKEPDVLFIGDAQIALLEQSETFRNYFAPFHCLCFACPGDTTSNILWRLQNGEIDCIDPKVVVLLAGTNIGGQSAENILAGIKAIAELIRQKQPEAVIFVLKIPPRGRKPNPLRELINSVNDGLKTALQGVRDCKVLDITEGLTDSDGTIDHTLMFDYLHFTNRGFEKAFDVVQCSIQNVICPDSFQL